MGSFSETKLTVSNLEELDALAGKLAKELQAGDTILLDGELGSGKTEFIRCVAKRLGVSDDITSPTFCFVNTYTTPRDFNIYHFDVYRLASEDELSEVGFDDWGYNPADGVSFIEWADKFSDCMPSDSLSLIFRGQGDNPREISVAATENRGRKLMEALL